MALLFDLRVGSNIAGSHESQQFSTVAMVCNLREEPFVQADTEEDVAIRILCALIAARPLVDAEVLAVEAKRAAKVLSTL